MPELEIIGAPQSNYVWVSRIACHEKGVPYTLVPVMPHTAEVDAIHPLGKIPALVLDDGSVLIDSPVICEYLDALDGEPQLFPLDRKLRIVALRRQALGDGFLDLLVLARNERLREQPSQLHLTSAAVRSAAVLGSLEREADALAASAFDIGHIAIGCALSYFDFRFADQDWRKDNRRLAIWHAVFAARPSVEATRPVDDS